MTPIKLKLTEILTEYTIFSIVLIDLNSLLTEKNYSYLSNKLTNIIDKLSVLFDYFQEQLYLAGDIETEVQKKVDSDNSININLYDSLREQIEQIEEQLDLKSKKDINHLNNQDDQIEDEELKSVDKLFKIDLDPLFLLLDRLGKQTTEFVAILVIQNAFTKRNQIEKLQNIMGVEQLEDIATNLLEDKDKMILKILNDEQVVQSFFQVTDLINDFQSYLVGTIYISEELRN